MSGALLHTPFHPRTEQCHAAHNWVARGRFTVPAAYTDAHQEALAARFSCVLADVSALEDLRIEGRGAASFIATALGADMQSVIIGETRSAFWCSDGGGLRGTGRLMRMGDDAFVLRSADCDLGWFWPQAARFDAGVRDVTGERGLLLVSGPFAAVALGAAGMDAVASLEADGIDLYDLDGVPVTITREPALNGFLIAAPAGECIPLFDRLVQSGRPAGLRLAGQQAVDILSLEAGIPLSHRDFIPARTPLAREPLPSAFGLGTEDMGAGRILSGIEFTIAEPVAFAPLFREGAVAGQTLRSAYSPALKRAIALAQVELRLSIPGTILQARIRRGTSVQEVQGRLVALPFLP